MHIWPNKDPDEILDYQFDWTDRLTTGETLSTSDFILASGDVVLGAESVTSPFTTVWISGGTVGTSNIITNRVTTSEGRTYDESAKLRVRTK